MISPLVGLMLIGELPSLFSIDDYPAAALRQGQQGLVEVELAITPEGRVGACNVILSSGFPPLDQGTCAIFLKRARFKPATDDKGNPVEGQYRQKVRWELPASTAKTGEPSRNDAPAITPLPSK